MRGLAGPPELSDRCTGVVYMCPHLSVSSGGQPACASPGTRKHRAGDPCRGRREGNRSPYGVASRWNRGGLTTFDPRGDSWSEDEIRGFRFIRPAEFPVKIPFGIISKFSTVDECCVRWILRYRGPSHTNRDAERDTAGNKITKSDSSPAPTGHAPIPRCIDNTNHPIIINGR